jgi:glycosyltransferase involved in cell wall biosynthesis
VRELDFLATRFDELVHLAILHPEAPPASSLPYTAKNIRPVLLPPAGGSQLADKAGILKLAPEYLGEIRRQMQTADIVQVRCPANLSLLALLSLILSSKPRYRWFKYAGNWRPTAGGEAFSYRLQRLLLARNWARGPVTVNGSWPDQPAHIFSLNNPSLSQKEIQQAKRLTAGKALDQPMQFLFVGRVESAKGLGQALRVLARLKDYNIPFRFDVVGGGSEQEHFREMAYILGIGEQVCLHGYLSREEMEPFYCRAHFLLHPSQSSEGWPKAISEAMTYGAVPLASAISSIPQILGEIGCGMALPGTAIDPYVSAILEYRARPERWLEESQRGQQASHRFTFEAYIASLEDMFCHRWGISLPA